jgi:hypothetical protein
MAPRFAQSTRFLVAIVGMVGALSIFLIEPPEFMDFVWIAVVLVVSFSHARAKALRSCLTGIIIMQTMNLRNLVHAIPFPTRRWPSNRSTGVCAV